VSTGLVLSSGQAHQRSFGGGFGQQAEDDQAHREPIRWAPDGPSERDAHGPRLRLRQPGDVGEQRRAHSWCSAANGISRNWPAAGAAWKMRAAVAATLSPSYGIYAGYELMEHVARPGADEQIDNEKYQ
jgi:hypothetical protein